MSPGWGGNPTAARFTTVPAEDRAVSSLDLCERRDNASGTPRRFERTRSPQRSPVLARCPPDSASGSSASDGTEGRVGPGPVTQKGARRTSRFAIFHDRSCACCARFRSEMREIVHIQAGQAGNQVGAKFWEVRGSRKLDTGKRNAREGAKHEPSRGGSRTKRTGGNGRDRRMLTLRVA